MARVLDRRQRLCPGQKPRALPTPTYRTAPSGETFAAQLGNRSTVSVSVTEPFAPCRSATLTFQGVVRLVRSLGGEVTLSTDALASCVTERSHEAVSNLRDLLCVELAYHRRDQDAVQQDLQRHAEAVGPFAQERPVSRLNVVRGKVYDGVRRFAVSVRDSIIRHGRFLILNRDRSRLCRVGECYQHLPARSFLWVRATIETAISLVKGNYCAAQ
jgi:hypothetical protein